MPKKNKRPNWQQQGFRNYTDYLQFKADQTKARTLYNALKAADERAEREASDREKYHDLRLKELGSQKQ